MKNIIYVIMVLMISIVTKSIAQDRSCSTMENLAYQLEKDPGLKDRMESIEKFTSSFINNHKSGNRDVVYTIPIVVHVVYNGSSENISDAQVLSQIDVLNEDFRRLNADANGTWSQASDSEIEFCLATMDPSGNASNGITRTSTNVSTFGLNDEIKFNSSGGKDAWPASDYLNLWVGDLPNGYLGYAQFPGGAAATDGVVIDYIYFGTSGTATSPFDLGRTATHEVGHWLNLRHIWGDGNCSQDDFVTDTPSSDAPNYGCASGHVSCSTTDMVENYMDYSDDACMNLFTSGQRSRMRALFGSGGSKESLLNSTGCGSGTSSSCTDGIQNGNETGIDCGGSDCAPCSTECANNDVNISITFDNYPEETSWEIINSSGSVIESGGTYGSEADGSTLSIDVCLLNGCYDFVISDSYGDGICCSYGNGSYIVTEGGVTLANGGSFGVTELTNFCIGTSAPTCTDGVQNGDETGIDCGGSNCVECPSCTDGIQNGNETGVDCGGTECAPCSSSNSEVFAHYFESGWDGWSDGGSDCYRYNGSRSYEGTKSIRLRDNSGSSSSMTSSSYDVSSYNSLEIEFYFYPYSMENGEDFYVKYYDGTNWHTIAVYTKGTNFSNNNFYVATVNIDGSYNMPSNARFRFQCDASNNSDHIYIDAVTVTGITGGSKTNNIGQSIIALSPMFDNEEEVNELDFQMYPNPASNILNITAQEKIYVINIYSLEGKVIQSINTNTERIDVDVSSLSSGLYIISLETEEEVYTDKFIKR